MSNRYADYTATISEATSTASVHYDASEKDGRLVRFTHLVYRIPSSKRLVIYMFHDATPQDRQFVERTLHVHGALFLQGHDGTRKRRPNGTYSYSIKAGRIVDDPMVQLELEMMIDLSSGVTA